VKMIVKILEETFGVSRNSLEYRQFTTGFVTTSGPYSVKRKTEQTLWALVG
jgi:hypothetical protein